jgi:hypothetical protein
MDGVLEAFSQTNISNWNTIRNMTIKIQRERGRGTRRVSRAILGEARIENLL